MLSNNCHALLLRWDYFPLAAPAEHPVVRPTVNALVNHRQGRNPCAPVMCPYNAPLE
ncbi:MAG: hypothetical protein F6K55_23660 [Moorea sp. SIO4A3]|nr:hypothetical protein [Moorena sp. SIO4A3]